MHKSKHLIGIWIEQFQDRHAYLDTDSCTHTTKVAVREDLYTTMRDLSAKTVPNINLACVHRILLRHSPMQTLLAHALLVGCLDPQLQVR